MAEEFEVVQHPQIQNITVFYVSVDYRTPHLHRDLEVDLVLDGEAVFICQSRTITARAGTFVLLNSNEAHEIRTQSGPADILCIQMAPRLLREVYPAFEHVHFDSMLPFGPGQNAAAAEMRRLCLALALAYLQKPPYHEVLCSGLVQLMLYQLLREVPLHQFTRDEMREVKKRVERLNRIIQYVDENYMHNLRLTDIAAAEGLSLSYLSHFVKDNLNQTFQEYVATVRFNRARQLLLAGEQTTLDVCIEAGFSDPRYMAKAFLAHTGLSPDEFRRRYHDVAQPANVHRSLHTSQRYYAVDEAVQRLSLLQNQAGL